MPYLPINDIRMELTLSPVIAGTMKWGQWGSRFTTEAYLDMIEHCLSIGVTTFDHADIYGHYTTEAEFGAALALKPSLRQHMHLITKCGICMVTPNRPAHRIKSYNTSREHIIASAERSLQQLHTDHIDLLLIHRPDPLMHPQEIAEAFLQLQQSGKVLQFGVSNFAPSQAALIHAVWPLYTNQLEVSAAHLQPFHDGSLDHCLQHNIIPTAWSPLGSGSIFQDDPDEKAQRILAVARLLGEQYGLSADQVLLAFLQTHPSGILPVLGTSRKERITAAYANRNNRLTREEWFMIWRAATGHEVA